MTSTLIDRYAAATRSRATGVAAALLMPWFLVAPTTAASGIADEPCPRGAIAVEPGTSIQAAVDLAGDGAAFCLKNGVHRMQAVRPSGGKASAGKEKRS